MRRNVARCFLYHFEDEDTPTNPVWYAGLGVPFKLTSDIQYAKSVSFDTKETELLIGQLERYYDKSFYQVLLKDAMPTPDFRCGKCSVSWTHDELRVIKHQDDYLGSVYDTHLGSPLRREKDRDSFVTKVSGAARCLNTKCSTLYCADCAPPKRGINASTCGYCRPLRRRGQAGIGDFKQYDFYVILWASSPMEE